MSPAEAAGRWAVAVQAALLMAAAATAKSAVDFLPLAVAIPAEVAVADKSAADPVLVWDWAALERSSTLPAMAARDVRRAAAAITTMIGLAIHPVLIHATAAVTTRGSPAAVSVEVAREAEQRVAAYQVQRAVCRDQHVEWLDTANPAVELQSQLAELRDVPERAAADLGEPVERPSRHLDA